MKLNNPFRRWENGFKVLGMDEEGRTWSSFSPCPQEYMEGKTVKRRKGNGPLACVETRDDAEIYEINHDIHGIASIICPCKYKKSRDVLFWCIRKGKLDLWNHPIPSMTVFADKIKTIKNKNKGD